MTRNIKMFSGMMHPGMPDQEFDISHLPSGIYFIRIYIENQMIVKKIIKH